MGTHFFFLSLSPSLSAQSLLPSIAHGVHVETGERHSLTQAGARGASGDERRRGPLSTHVIIIIVIVIVVVVPGEAASVSFLLCLAPQSPRSLVSVSFLNGLGRKSRCIFQTPILS